MSISALIRRMAEAGATPEAIAIAVEAIEEGASLDAQRRAKRAEQKRQERARSATVARHGCDIVRHDGDTPHPPALDKETPPTPPKETNPTPLTPRAGLIGGREPNDLDGLTAKLCDAAGDKIQPHGALVVGPILELIAQGVDLETDILPVIRSASARMTRPASRWTYFVGAIKDAHAQRIEAGRGVAVPKPAIKRDDELTDDERRARWRKYLNVARSSGVWHIGPHGPPPGREGCRVPPDLLEPRDKSRDWFEQREAA